MNLNLSHSAEGILSIVHRRKSQTRYLTNRRVKRSNTAIRERETRKGKGGPPDIQPAPKKEKPSIGKKHKIEPALTWPDLT
jgi:hypothetical protein